MTVEITLSQISMSFKQWFDVIEVVSIGVG